MTKITVAMLDDIEDIQWDGIHGWDAPDFCDAYITSASWKSTGKNLTDNELDDIMDNHRDWVYDQLQRHLY